MESRRYNENTNHNVITQDDIKKYHGLMLESKIEIDNEALVVIASLLRLGVPPDDIYFILKQIPPVCGLLKRFKIKTPRSASSSIPNQQ